jgi:lipopolysaccharide export system protein LptA
MADQQLLCTGGIILSKGEVTGYANQLSGDVGLERVFLQGTPKIIITPNNSVPISLEANEFEIISNEDTIIAKGNPVITWSSAKVVSTQMAYKQKTQEIKLNGEVKVNYLDIAATGNQATYRANKGEIILVGNAQAVQGDNKLTGNEVYVSLLKKTIAIAGRAKVIIPEEVIK